MPVLKIDARDTPSERERAYWCLLATMAWPLPRQGQRRRAILARSFSCGRRRAELEADLVRLAGAWRVTGALLRAVPYAGSLQGAAMELEGRPPFPKHADHIERIFRHFRSVAHLCAAYSEGDSGVALERMRERTAEFLQLAWSYERQLLDLEPSRRRRPLALDREIWSVPLKWSIYLPPRLGTPRAASELRHGALAVA